MLTALNPTCWTRSFLKEMFGGPSSNCLIICEVRDFIPSIFQLHVICKSNDGPKKKKKLKVDPKSNRGGPHFRTLRHPSMNPDTMVSAILMAKSAPFEERVKS